MKINLSLLLALFMGIFSLQAETLFYKTDDSLITPEEHAVLYPIMLQTQFPTCLAYGAYIDNEIEVINHKIKEQLSQSGIEACFIPASLYELFFLSFVSDHFVDLEQTTKGFLKSAQNPNPGSNPPGKAMFLTGQFVGKGIQEAQNLNLKPETIHCHYQLNSYIHTALQNKSMPLPLQPQSYDQIIDSVDACLPTAKGSTFFLDSNAKLISDPVLAKLYSRETMKRFLAAELYAHEHHQFLLYRGSDYADNAKDNKPWIRDERIFTNRSISFGSTLFGGLLFDQGACGFVYMLKKSFGHALSIDKKEYAAGLLANKFYIPRLTTLLDMVGEGEYFHSRTKVPNLADVEPQSFGGWGSTSVAQYTAEYQIAADSPEKAAEIYAQTINYIDNPDNKPLFLIEGDFFR